MLSRSLGLARFSSCSAFALLLGLPLVACGNGDDDDASGSDAGPASAPDTGAEEGEVGCDVTASGVHECTDYQYLTAAQQATITAQCTAMGGTVFTMQDTPTSQGESCTEDNEVGSCETATGDNIKQFVIYYADDGYTEAQAMTACTAANGTFKE